MTWYSIWPAVVTVGLALLALSPRRLLAFLDEAPAVHHHRLDTIDGLRGILASAVFFHHTVSYAYILRIGKWGVPPSRIYHSIGPVAVLVFFMITGYLFWGKLVGGRMPASWVDFYINRLFRIGPLYLVLVLCYFAFVIWHAGFPAQQPIPTVVMQVLGWLALGSLKQPNPFLDLLGYARSVGPTWSLHYEWLFYLALPVLSVLASGKSASFVAFSSLLSLLTGLEMFTPPYHVYLESFLIGMCTASALADYPKIRGDDLIRSTIASCAVVAGFTLWSFSYTTTTTLLFGIFFFTVASGSSVFGLLKLRGVKRLGSMSYSIYLMHELVNSLLTSIPRYQAHLTATPVRFWLATFLAYALVIIVSCVTYRFVERTGIDLGRIVVDRVRSGSAGSVQFGSDQKAFAPGAVR